MVLAEFRHPDLADDEDLEIFASDALSDLGREVGLLDDPWTSFLDRMYFEGKDILKRLPKHY